MRRLWYSLVYAVWLAWQVLRNALVLAWDVMTPGMRISPSIIEFPLRAQTAAEVAIIESSITVTPGTLTLGIVEETDGHPRSLFVHFLYAHTHEAAIAELEEMERRMLMAARGRCPDRLGLPARVFPTNDQGATR